MGVPGIDFRFSNTADWRQGFSIRRHVARLPPWLAPVGQVGTPAWAPGQAYDVGVARTVGGDLYVAAPDRGAGPWISALTFEADTLPSGATRWLRVGRAADYATDPLDLTNVKIVVGLKVCDPETGAILDPRPKLRAGTDDGGFVVTNARLGGVAWALPKWRARGVTPGSYRYDINAVHADGSEARLRYGLVLVDEGCVP